MKLSQINIRDPFVLIEDGKIYLYRSLCQNPQEGNEMGFCVFVSADGENFEKKAIFHATPEFWADKQFWAPEVHKIDGRFYLFATVKKEGLPRASHIFSCDTPDGTFLPMDKPLTPTAWDCLDATFFEENGKRYTVFCHEWLQCRDGEMILAELDEKFCISGKTQKLFCASEAPWVRPYSCENYITDGLFLYRRSCGGLLMLWSSFGEKGYAMGMATADTIYGPWKHAEKPLISSDGGHGMIYENDGRLSITFHTPNGPKGAERMCVREVYEENGLLVLK